MISLNDLSLLGETAEKEVNLFKDVMSLNIWRKDKITALSVDMKALSTDERKQIGIIIKIAREKITSAYNTQLKKIESNELETRLIAEAVDLTLPPRRPRIGRLHPLRATLREVVSAFEKLGFSIYDSPHVETDEYNFQLLNIPPHHPARDMQDTFYLKESSNVLRTHTSAGQIRAMRELGVSGTAPVRVVLPGVCYRNEDITARSEIQFSQIEGLMVGESVRLSDLKGILLQFAKTIFGDNQAVRMRGSYFPFTEPSVEVDLKCAICVGVGCKICKYSGWLELLGAGMVHPTVLINGGYDPTIYRGIAFGVGLPRLVMLRHQIDDIRHFYRNDLRFLKNF